MKKGFTLIELLIVVAIIAILASIAVPNFLEAQVRAKVSRAHGDMHAMKVAVELYNTDLETYPYSCCPDSQIFVNQGRSGTKPETTWGWYSGITTPISYIASLPLDPFSVMEGDSWGGGNGANPYHYYSGNGLQWENTPAYQYARRKFFVIVSNGPDGVVNMTIDVTHSDAYMLYDITKTNQGGSSCDGFPYDATNGTKSVGDIYSWGGTGVLPKFES